MLNATIIPSYAHPYHAIPYAHHAVKALLHPIIVIPINAPTIHKCFECVKSKLSANNCNATLAKIPAVTANIAPYPTSLGCQPVFPANLNQRAATPAPSGWERPPSTKETSMALRRLLMAR